MRPIETIEFNIKFITPLLIHGADSGRADSTGLTGKALRGCWRFWFRALVGGMVQDITKEKLLELEGKVFGASDEKVGATFRMVITPPTGLKPVNDIPPGFNRGFKFSGFPVGSEFAIAILPRKSLIDDGKIEVLLASIWLWANLGGIGQRARRGFGSPVIELHTNNISPFDNLNLQVQSQFSEATELREHLCSGLSIVWMIFEQWLKEMGCMVTGAIVTNLPPTNAKYFILSSLGQIAVGDKPFSEWKGSAQKVHGSNRCNGLGWAKGNSRMASPIFTRFHKVSKNDKDLFLPVITWCHQKVEIKKIGRAHV